MAKTDLPIIEQRRIEANIIKPIYEEMKTELGEEVAKRVLGNAVVKAAIEAGKAYAAERKDGKTDLKAFHSLLPQWTHGGALEIEMVEQLVHRCIRWVFVLELKVADELRGHHL